MHVSGMSLNQCLVERTLGESVLFKAEMPWRHQDARDTTALGYLPRKAANRKWNQPKRSVLQSIKSKELEIYRVFKIRHGIEVLNLPSWFLVILWSRISSHCFLSYIFFFAGSMLSVFLFCFYRKLQLIDCKNCRKGLELWTFKCCWNCGRLWELLKLD